MKNVNVECFKQLYLLNNKFNISDEMFIVYLLYYFFSIDIKW